jgi:hypothetical protein
MSIVSNIVLPAALSQAAAQPNVHGGSFSLCLANSDAGSVTPDNNVPTEPTASHCNLCLISGGFDGPISNAGSIATEADYPDTLVFGYPDSSFSPQITSLIFDARAPPA